MQEYTNQQELSVILLSTSSKNTSLWLSKVPSKCKCKCNESGYPTYRKAVSKSVKQVHAYTTTKHTVLETRLQASATVASTRVHQLALEPASDNILTQGQIVTIPCSWIDYSPSLDLDLDLSKLISQLNKYKININVFNKHNAHQSFWDVSWLRRWKNL